MATVIRLNERQSNEAPDPDRRRRLRILERQLENAGIYLTAAANVGLEDPTIRLGLATLQSQLSSLLVQVGEASTSW